MKMFNKVVIVGTGLLGGSIALAIKKKKLAREVAGISRHKSSIAFAKKIHAIDSGSQDINIAKGADLIIFATPVGAILALAPKIAGLVDKGCIVTDVGSTKEEISAKLSKLFPGYVGSHPMAGSEKRGIKYADARILEDSLCLVTSRPGLDKQACRKVAKLWNELGFRVSFLTPGLHDKIISFVSHLPHVVAFSLMSSVPAEYFKFSSGGLKDTTRIAASEAELWTDIFLTNRKNLLKAMSQMEQNLARIRSAVNKKDKVLLTRIIRQAHNKRVSLS